MRNYSPMRIPPMADRVLRGELRRTDMWLRQLAVQQGRTVTLPQGTPSANVSLGTQLLDYMYLPGRRPYQRQKDVVIFEANGNTQQDYTQGFAAVQGLMLEAINASGGNSYPERVYFQIENSGDDSHRQWIFPAIGVSGNLEQRTFASTTGTQTFTGKLIQAGTIYVGTGSAANTFTSLDSGTKSFKIAPNTGFPASPSIPTMWMPSLDTDTDEHSYMFLHSNSTLPFTTGSIAHGNWNGSEMEMLAASSFDKAFLQWNVGETVAGCTWSAGGTTITGIFNTNKIVNGMRVRGGTIAGGVYVQVGTKITNVTAGVITVDTTLVGNGGGGVTCTFYGPTWSTSLAAFDHGSLGGLTDDDHTQYLRLAGRSGGQIIGNGTHSGANQASDVAIEGQLLIDHADTNTAFSSTTALDIRTRHPGALGNVINLSANIGSATVPSDIQGIAVNINGSVTTGNSGPAQVNVRGFSFANVGTVGAGTTVTESIAGRFISTFGTTSTGVLEKVVGIRSQAVGTGNASTHVNGVTGIEVDINQRAGTTTLKGVHLRAAAGTQTGAVSEYVGFDCGSTAILDSNTIVDYFQIRIPNAPTTPTGTIRGLAVGSIKSHHVGAFRFGSTTTPTHLVEIAAGTTTVAPLMLTSGTSLTSPVAGTIEFTTDDFFATITTGPARKAFVLDDGTRLTSGRVPFATTNGRLTDDADMTFATDTLTVTKIAATQFTGDVQFTGSGVGWPYGSCYGNEIGWSQATAAAGTFYEVSDTDMTDGELNNVTHDGSGKLTVSIAGRYLINYSVSLEADAANIHLVSAISVNGTEIAPGRMHFHRASASAAIPLPGTAIVNLAANDTVEVAVATADAGTPTLSVEHLNISVLHVGG